LKPGLTVTDTGFFPLLARKNPALKLNAITVYA